MLQSALAPSADPSRAVFCHTASKASELWKEIAWNPISELCFNSQRATTSNGKVLTWLVYIQGRSVDATLTNTIRGVCFGPGRVKTKLNCKGKLGSLPRKSRIMTGMSCISLALHHQQQNIQATLRWRCAEGCSEDFTWWGITTMFVLLFCNIKKPPWEPSRNLVIWKVTRLSGILESWKRGF